MSSFTLTTFLESLITLVFCLKRPRIELFSMNALMIEVLPTLALPMIMIFDFFVAVESFSAVTCVDVGFGRLD